MTTQEFAKLTEKLFYMDGATGTILYKAGMPKGVSTEAWVLEHPDVIQALQREYAEAGSQMVYAPTFGANRAMLARHGLEGKIEEMNQRLVALSQEAVGGKVLIAGDLAPTGLLPESAGGEDSIDDIFEVYREQAEILDRAGVDLFGVETMMSVDETSVALDAIKSVCDKPVICTMTVNADGRGYYGGTIFEAVETLQEQGASAVGVNCCSGPDQIESLIASMKKIARIPIIAKPNAGLPIIDETGNAVYTMGAQEFAEHMKTIVAAGASVIGGCCGTSPEFIRKMHLLFDGQLISV